MCCRRTYMSTHFLNMIRNSCSLKEGNSFLVWKLKHPRKQTSVKILYIEENPGSSLPPSILQPLPDSSMSSDQRHRDRRPSTPACPGCWALGTNKIKKCVPRKIIFCTGLTRAARTGQKCIVPAQGVLRTNHRRTPSIFLFESPFTSETKVSRGHSSLVSLFWYMI
jgi:hypothetical protein